jgi:tricorn protease interacting factor F2/3
MRAYEPVHYRLHLEPDLDSLTFAGEVSVTFRARKPVSDVHLDCLGLDVRSVTAESNGAEYPCEFTVEEESLVVELTHGRATGEFVVRIAYGGEINDLLAGFYRSSYRTDGKKRYLAVTQFEEHDARRAFPCVDEPGAKAPYSISMLAPPETVAISNEAPESIVDQPDGSRLFRFRETPPMSTYLVFFAVGPFEIAEDTTWRIPIRVAVSPGFGSLTGPALEYARKSLSYLEEFTGVEYPLSKLDSIGVNDFAFGAMENFGAISYRETFLLDVPETTTRREREGMMHIAAHEIAHMWFGDLVSPSAWRYVWLNEAFATFLGNVTTDAWFPEWRTMDQFVTSTQASSMSRDAHPHTVAIELERDEIEIDASTAPIVYQKGANILRMLRAFYGDSAFGNACQIYLKRYSFASATSAGFIETFGGALGTGAERLLAGWIEQPGVPLVRVERDGRRLHLRQERFLASGEQVDAPAWVIPITGLSDSGHEVQHILDRTEATVELDADVSWVKLNSEQTGYYRVFYESSAELDRLGAAAAEGALSDLDRYGLLADLGAFVNAGLVSIDRYLSFVKTAFANERAFSVVAELATTLLRFYELSDRDERIGGVGRELLAPFAPKLLAEPSASEPYENVLLRERVLWALASFGDESVRGSLEKSAKDIVAGRSVHPDLIPLAIKVWALVDSSSVEWITDRIRDPDTAEGRRVNLIAALSAVDDAKVVPDVLDFVLRDIPSRNWLYFLRAGAERMPIRARLLDWLLASIDKMLTAHTHHLGSSVMICCAEGGIGRSDEVSEFLDRFRGLATGVDEGVLQLTIDRLKANETLAERLRA